MDFKLFANQLQKAGFQGETFFDEGTRTVYSTDNSIYQLLPKGVVVPACENDLVLLCKHNVSRAQPFALVGRGGGTGTNGQSLTTEVVVDLRRNMNRIVDIDVQTQTARVQPGVVLEQLNDALRPHGLFFAAHAATGSRATLGGMAATDAAGKGSLVFGRTNKHVRGVRAVLANGEVIGFGTQHVESTKQQQIEASLAKVCQKAMGYDFPAVPRGFTGYNLQEAWNGQELTGTRLLCGSEGTLALFSELEVQLTKLPQEKWLAVCTYATFSEAIADAQRLKETGPIAIECMDNHTVSKSKTSKYYSALRELIPVSQEALLILEFHDAKSLAVFREQIAQSSKVIAHAITESPEQIATIWKVRKDAVGLLGKPKDGKASIPFVEDCAVPPVYLEEFVSRFRKLLDAKGLQYGMFGHADVGCVHVRPSMNLELAEHASMIRDISDEVAKLTEEFGGVLWGEHGRGFRSEYLGLHPELVTCMREVKGLFDPQNLLNPGKLYTPADSEAAIVKVDDVALRAAQNRSVSEDVKTNFQSAFACNGNGACHNWNPAETMCPSYKVTSDPRYSPKGRADLLRAWAKTPENEALTQSLAQSMQHCLSCSACTGQCPIEVDIPELKSRFLEQVPETGLQAFKHSLLLGFEALLPKTQWPLLGSLQVLAKPVLSALGLIDLPAVPRFPLQRELRALGCAWVKSGKELQDESVVILADGFTAYLEPTVLVAAVRTLQAMGEKPAVAQLVASGKYAHVKGFREQFQKHVAEQKKLVESFAVANASLLVLEPAVQMLFAHEYKETDKNFPSDAVENFGTYLEKRAHKLPKTETPETFRFFQHCTEAAMLPEQSTAWARVLKACGHQVEVVETTCCGMAGIFGHEKENQDISRALFETTWKPLLTSAKNQAVATGFSCRSQAKRFGHAITHPIHFISDSRK